MECTIRLPGTARAGPAECGDTRIQFFQLDQPDQQGNAAFCDWLRKVGKMAWTQDCDHSMVLNSPS